jgi:hypothetical protein
MRIEPAPVIVLRARVARLEAWACVRVAVCAPPGGIDWAHRRVTRVAAGYPVLCGGCGALRITTKLARSSYRDMLTRMAKESGIETPTAEALIRLDRKRKGKRLANAEWKSPTEPL